MVEKRNEAVGQGGHPASPDDPGPRIPGWLAPALVVAVTLFLFRDFVFSDQMLFGGDTLSLGYMARDFYGEALENGTFPLWNPLLLGGIPFVESLAAGDSLYPPSALLLLLLDTHRALGWKLVVHVALGGVFMAGWVRALGCSRSAALVAALAFAVAPFLVTLVHPGHDGKLFVTALTPLLFWAMESTFTRRGLLPFVGVALVVTTVLLTTHFQLAYFLFGAAGLYYAFRVGWAARGGTSVADDGGADGDAAKGASAPTPRRLTPAGAAGRFGVFLAASVLGAAAAGVQLLPAVDYVTESSRRTLTTTRATPEENRAYASSWSMHPEEVVGLVVPEFPGNDAGGAAWTEGTYWGRNPTRDNHQYAGIVVLVLAVVGFLGTPRRGIRWFLAALGALSIGYALGAHSPVWHLLYTVLPGISLFRAPDMVAFLFGFAVVTLAAFGVDRLLLLAGGTRAHAAGGGREGREAAERADRRVVTVMLGLTGALLVGTLLAASGALTDLWTSTVYRSMEPNDVAALNALEPYIGRGFFVATLLAALVAGAAVAARRGFLKPVGVVGLLVVLVTLDGGRVSAPFIQTLDFEAWAAPDPLVQEMLERQEQEDPFRVVSFERAGQEVKPAQHGLELASGHHPNDLARYRELIGMRGSGVPELLLRSANVRRVLNVRYVVWPDASYGSQPDDAFGPGSRVVARTQLRGRVYQTLYAVQTLPRARLVARARVVAEDETVPLLLSEGFDPGAEVLLTEEPPLTLGGGEAEGSVSWEVRRSNLQRLTVSTDRNALLVVADNWYPAWHATVDGERVPLLRAYHSLRAVPVPAGEHTVELTYRSAVLRTGLGISTGALLILLGVGTASYLRRRRGSDRPAG